MTSEQGKPPFPCNGCGKCCRKVSNSPETKWLDRGDSVCRHFSEDRNSCTIYETRPLICRVEDYYDRYLSDKIHWDKFVKLNMEICHSL